MKIVFGIVLFMVLLFATNCKKTNNNNTGVPLVSVNLSLYINNPSYAKLNAVGGWMYVAGGVKGILIYRYSSSEFRAYDRDCTYQPTNGCAVSVNTTNIIAIDSSCCHSQFSIVDGSVTQGPASTPLKAYNTSFDGNILQIFN